MVHGLPLDLTLGLNLFTCTNAVSNPSTGHVQHGRLQHNARMAGRLDANLDIPMIGRSVSCAGSED